MQFTVAQSGARAVEDIAPEDCSKLKGCSVECRADRRQRAVTAPAWPPAGRRRRRWRRARRRRRRGAGWLTAGPGTAGSAPSGRSRARAARAAGATARASARCCGRRRVAGGRGIGGGWGRGRPRSLLSSRSSPICARLQAGPAQREQQQQHGSGPGQPARAPAQLTAGTSQPGRRWPHRTTAPAPVEGDARPGGWGARQQCSRGRQEQRRANANSRHPRASAPSSSGRSRMSLNAHHLRQKGIHRKLPRKRRRPARQLHQRADHHAAAARSGVDMQVLG